MWIESPRVEYVPILLWLVVIRVSRGGFVGIGAIYPFVLLYFCN